MGRTRGDLPFDPTESISDITWVKIVGVGDSGVGKTCLVKRFCEEKFTAKFHPTVGIDYGFKIHSVKDTDVRVHFWDMAGKIEYYDVRNELYNQTQAVMLVFDVTNRVSFQSLEAWNRECARCSATPPMVTVVVANKIDLDVERVVTKDEGEKWAIAHKLPYWETSAASGSGVYETFHTMLGDVVELLKRSKHDINKS